jgi:hypothetical protein
VCEASHKHNNYVLVVSRLLCSWLHSIYHGNKCFVVLSSAHSPIESVAHPLLLIVASVPSSTLARQANVHNNNNNENSISSLISHLTPLTSPNSQRGLSLNEGQQDNNSPAFKSHTISRRKRFPANFIFSEGHCRKFPTVHTLLCLLALLSAVADSTVKIRIADDDDMTTRRLWLDPTPTTSHCTTPANCPSPQPRPASRPRTTITAPIHLSHPSQPALRARISCEPTSNPRAKPQC